MIASDPFAWLTGVELDVCSSVVVAKSVVHSEVLFLLITIWQAERDYSSYHRLPVYSDQSDYSPLISLINNVFHNAAPLLLGYVIVIIQQNR